MMVPDVAIGVSLLGDPALEMGLIRAYHRFVNDAAAAYPGRFKALLAVSGTDVEGSVAGDRAMGQGALGSGRPAVRGRWRAYGSPTDGTALGERGQP